ncbi:MAG: glycoside hydrolase [Pirellulales bacterium]|nr:glycoside hydrolase [Pirellulales bacterium]
MRTFALLAAWIVAAHVCGQAVCVEQVDIYHVPGRFGGWPANHGMWSWDNELLVGFSAGYHKDNGPNRHAVDHAKPEEHLLARSLDGGQTWAIENPAEYGALIPHGASLHGIAPPELAQPTPSDCKGGINFAHPDFALTVRMTNSDIGPSRFYYSYDRGRRWHGPFRLPQFDTPGIAARTDYIVNGSSECLLMLTAGKQNGKEGRPLCVRTTDGGTSWKLVSFIGPEPKGFAIMPATVRLGDNELLTTLRVHEGSNRWIDAWKSTDNGASWQLLSRPVPDTGSGNPAALVKLKDGRLFLAYGYRAKPFSIRARLSADGGQSWSDDIVLRDGGGGTDLGYPRAVQRPDGKVVVVYYFHDQPLTERYIAATIWDPRESLAKGGS